MNKLIRMILWISIVISTSCAISKKENERVDKLLSQQSKKIDIPVADSITTDMLRKFEIRATQKLEDFYDYLELLGNKSYSESMKNEIKVSAQGIFYHSNSSVILFEPSSKEQGSIEEALILLDEMSSGESLSISKIEITKPLTLADKDLFIGQINFLLTIGKEENVISLEKNADFSLRKVEKNLGTESIVIWETFLDRIE